MTKTALSSGLACVAMMSFGLQTTSFAVELSDTVVSSIKAEVLYVDTAARQLHVMELEGPGPDQKDPMVTSNWFFRSFSVSPDVATFDFVRAGDKVHLDVTMSLVVDIRKPTDAEIASPFQSVTNTEKEGVLTHSVTAVCDVLAVDTKNNTITLKGPGGRKFSVGAAKGELSGRAKAGDKIVITFTQGAVVALSRAD